ncbi:MAG TPA: hypothetical protein VM286_01270 [Candidatus Thermoplasmatota archaeon]|nr:hypothetical protein [Candidatus Thermoplasmatota archaeon]
MRPVLLLLLAVALLSPPAHAQMEFSQPYQVRAAAGDIPSTQGTVEKAGTWNVEQLLVVTHANGTAQTLHLNLPAGATSEAVTCTCPRMTSQAQDGAITVTLAADNPQGPATVRVLSSQPFSTSLGFSLRAPTEAPKDAAVILYVPRGSTFEAPAKASSPGSSTDGASTIQAFAFDAGAPMPDPFWATIHPGTSTSSQPAAGFPWLPLLGGLLLGILLWAFLVQRGIVQKRGRKQVAQVAAHAEIAASDPPAVLEGKKRALLAALKEVELAKQASQMDNATYDAVKADFKRQAVNVMRALDEGAGKQS